MAKRMAVLIEDMGAVYKVTARNWERFLRDCAKGTVTDAGLRDYGRKIGVIECDVTDLDEEGAQDRLDEWKKGKS